MLSTIASSSAASASSPPTTGQGSIRATNLARNSASEKTAAQQQATARTIAELAATDRKVRAHEAAHLAAAQGLATSGASFSYTTGPDGKRYAVGGEVSIDISAARTPTDTLLKADQIRRAALAPADPSAQDLQVAAMADRMAADAQRALNQERVAAYTRTDAHQSGTQLDITA